ncbi:hypothetical protein I2I11_16375 [Pontibacter sp. 172403-2]|nr:hypothetical protein [Pontibacter sp. 172403-2]MBF9254880.1 hypothetical protein [Pontibacter sp. 172403-2]
MIAVLFSLMLNLSLATNPQAPAATTTQVSPTDAVCGGVLTWNEDQE